MYKRQGILESDACLALPDGCGGQFVPIDSLPEQLVLLYRSPQQTGDSALVSAVLFLGGTCRVCLYADNKACLLYTSYHGEAGFAEFTHKRSIVDKKTWMDFPIRYQPYTAKKLKLIRKFLYSIPYKG